MLMSEKITLFIAAWMIIIFLISIEIEFEIFFILILIGFLIVKVFTNNLTLSYLKIRMNIFAYAFFIIFIIIIGNKIINILST